MESSDCGPEARHVQTIYCGRHLEGLPAAVVRFRGAQRELDTTHVVQRELRGCHRAAALSVSRTAQGHWTRGGRESPEGPGGLRGGHLSVVARGEEPLG